MKIRTSLLLLVVALCLAACKKDNYSLPPETQTGAGTFGCKIDGKVWVPRGSDGNSGQNTKAFYQHIYPSPVGYVFNITATNYEKDPIETIGIGSDSLKIFEGMIMRLSNGEKGTVGIGRFSKTSNTVDVDYLTNDSFAGELHITRFDEVNRIVSGTFWFDAQNANGEIIHITEGRFDVKYTR